MSKSKPRYIRLDGELDDKVVKDADKLGHDYSSMVNLIVKTHYKKSTSAKRSN